MKKYMKYGGNNKMKCGGAKYISGGAIRKHDCRCDGPVKKVISAKSLRKR
jgi:hypothetical protein